MCVYTCILLNFMLVSRRGSDLERELSNTKAKYVKLLSDKFKIAVRKCVCVCA